MDEFTAQMTQEDIESAQSACMELINIKKIYKPDTFEDFVSVARIDGKTFVISVEEMAVDEDE